MAQTLPDTAADPVDLAALDQFIARVALAPDGTILRTNALFLELFDYRGWDLVGRNRSIFLPHGAMHADEGAIRRVFDEGQPFRGEVQRVRRDGMPCWVEASYAPVRDADGTLVEIVVIMQDITARKLKAADESGQIAAINTSQAVIHFALDGTVLDANALFLETMGYGLEEVVGRRHTMFVAPAEAMGEDYARFWRSLAEGRFGSGEFRRLARGGRPVWLRATYNPIFDASGRPFKVVKYAVDITAEKLRQADYEGQIDAIRKSQCVVTYDIDGTIRDANENFLKATGYRLQEVEGRHHRMFVDPSHVHSLEYEIFWSDLSEGRHRSGEFRRRGRDGSEIWLQATYSPVLDQDGKPFKIVEYAAAITREKLRQADHQGQIAALHKSQAVVAFALDGTILDANDNFLELTGYRLSQVRGCHHRLFVSPDEGEDERYATFWSDLAAGRHRSGEFKRICRDGREVWLQASYNPIFDMNGRPFKVVKNAVDITAEKLRQSDYEGQVAAIRESQCVVAFDMDGTIIEANANFLRATGYELSELVGRHHSLLVHEEFAASDQYKQFWQGLRQGQFLSARFRRLRKDGQDLWIQASYNPILDLNGRPFKVVKIATDITADVALAADLTRARHEVRHDGLTGLANRLGLSDFMRAALDDPGAGLTILSLDLDHFKPINDTFGHPIGDHVLREVAARLRMALRDDQIVARVGGDEFIVAAPDLSREAAAALADELIATVGRPIACERGSLTVGLSIGIAQAPPAARDPEEILRHADVALYLSKGGNRGTYSFHAEAQAGSAVAELDRHLAHEMQFGIKAEQFELAYRPRFTAEERVLEAVEVQVYWNHPERGTLAADRFLSLAEGSGLIVPLGDWVLRTACKAAAGWPLLTVSVPVSLVQFASGDLPGAVSLALRETGLAASRLELRVADGGLRFDRDRLRANLATLRESGVAVVVEGRIVGEDLTEGRAAWPVDQVSIDRQTRADLERRGHASLVEIARIETLLGFRSDRDTEDEEGADILTLRLDRRFGLRAFLSAEPRSAAAVAGLFARICA